ncbi:MAG: prepilin-type N-terminal cleavage/methylation domain-containing protein [bacterium]
MMNRLKILKNDAGFTMLEILVVAFIISILVTMGISSFVKARQRGYEAAGMHGMKSLGAAMQAYHNDYGRFTQFYSLQPRYIESGMTLSDSYPPLPSPFIRHFSLSWTFVSSRPHKFSIFAIGIYDHWQGGNDRIELTLTHEGVLKKRQAGVGQFVPAN